MCERLKIGVTPATVTTSIRGGPRTAATSNLELFVIIVSGWKPLTIITKSSILEVATVLDPPLTFEISIGNKVCRFIHLYRSPSQTQDEFQTFKSNLKLNLGALLCGNPFFTVMIGDFTTNFEGSELDFLTPHFGLP